MLKSMTAYGRACVISPLGRFSVEMQSVNRKHLEIQTTLPNEFLRFDSHGRAHARSQSRSDEISRRKRFTFAFVVGRRVSRNL